MTPELVGLLVLVAAGAVGLYVLACRLWPFTACRKCTGSGKSRSPSGKAWRDCRRCKGTGKRLRLGWRLANHTSKQAKNL